VAQSALAIARLQSARDDLNEAYQRAMTAAEKAPK